ncbi:hypothetical protein NRK68_31905 [Streptomyces yangpuensis]|uniref:Uncharacterized protein n=1 Tax=Streptomyces yangpuensis TaxID=1648182 RepID=A0ABY5Q5H1_9ACTN|nr:MULTISPECIES: hypothetical protein [Streptomyces]UUY51437.1 hypothetical protein NRK68_31905 [Streptomyces yangpuensis]
MRRSMSAAGAAVVLAGLITAAGPAVTAGAATGATGVKCTPKIQVLGSIGDESYMRDMQRSQGVFDFGSGDLAVGVSGHKPVYWTGTTVHRVPLTDPNQTGQVLAVNAHGLMVGVLRGFGGTSLFTYQAGAAAITALPDSYGSDLEADVNDAGYVVSRTGSGPGAVWKDGLKVRDLPVPADAGPGTRITMVTGINNRGDIIGMATQDHEVPETGEHLENTYPVLWPGDGTAARLLAPSGNDSYVQDLDESGRIVGYDWAGPWHEYRTWVWEPPLTGPGTTPGGLSSHPYATFEAISPTTNVSVGTAKFHPEEMTLPDQALLRAGSGPVKALPRLAAGQASMADAVSDADRVGGAAVNAQGKLKPVIWTCATRQAYNSGS